MRKYKLPGLAAPRFLLFKTFLFLFFLGDDVVAQIKPTSNRTFHLRVGANYRVTPFEIHFNNSSSANPRGIFVQKEHNFLTGFAFEYSVEKELRKNWLLLFTHQFRLLSVIVPNFIN